MRIFQFLISSIFAFSAELEDYATTTTSATSTTPTTTSSSTTTTVTTTTTSVTSTTFTTTPYSQGYTISFFNSHYRKWVHRVKMQKCLLCSVFTISMQSLPLVFC